MPASSDKQRRFMGADLGRAKAGMPTKTGMGMDKLRDFARKPTRRGRRAGKRSGRSRY